MDQKVYASKRVFSKKKKAAQPKDPALLKERLLLKGEKQLLEGHLFEALALFHQADSLGGFTEPQLYYRQGVALFEYGSEKGREQALLLANKKFKIAHTLDPLSKEILHIWGNTLALIGERKDNLQFLLSAKSKYEQALKLAKPSIELRWDYGVLWYQIGLHSEEPLDFQKAIEFFEALSLDTPILPSDFWLDFGVAYLELYKKTDQPFSMQKALFCFKTAVTLTEDLAEGWTLLAEALELLYETKGEDKIFIEANASFAKALKYNPTEDFLWIQWAHFLCKSGFDTQDPKKLSACIEKCQIIHNQTPSANGEILSLWGEALCYLGHLTENFELLCEGEAKILEALELDDNVPEYWYRLGQALSMFGSYFNHFDYYYQAVEKFQEGLSIDRCADFLWHAMGNAYATLGTLEGDLDLLEKSLKFFIKALELRSTPSLQVDYANCLVKIGELCYESGWIEEALVHFKLAFEMQPEAFYARAAWVFSYGHALTLYADITESEPHYLQALELFFHLLLLEEDVKKKKYHLHQRIAQIFCYLGDLKSNMEYFHSALYYLRLAFTQDEESDTVALDWAIALIHLGLLYRSLFYPSLEYTGSLFKEAEEKLLLSARLGNVHTYYQLSCLYSIQEEPTKALYFLEKAASSEALPSFEELLCDEWLENFRSTSAFRTFLNERPYIEREDIERDLEEPYFDEEFWKSEE